MYKDPLEHGLTYLMVSPFLYVLMFDTGSYWTHRLFHTRFLYSNFHSLHHQYQPVMIAASAANSIVDSLVGGGIPLWSPLFVLYGFGHGIPEISFQIALVFLMFSQTYIHAITDHKLSKGNILVDNHDHLTHHARSRCNYGTVFRFWDWICGTGV